MGGIDNQSNIPGEEVYKSKKLDENSPEIKARIANTLEAQQKVFERKNIDREKLENTYITI